MKLTFWNVLIPIFLFNIFQSLACDPIVITGTIIHENNCGLGPNGSINIDVTGGIPPYTFVWTNGDTTQNITDLSAGSYGVTVHDSNGCPGLTGFIVNLVDTLVISDLSIYPSCDGDLGTGIVSVSGGNKPYEYLWSNGSTDSIANNLNVGLHQVVVTDASGCIDSLDVEIITNPPLQVFPIVNHSVCFSDSGSVSLLILGGATPYIIDWDGVDSTAVGPGQYSVTVTDASSCEKMVNYTVLSEDEIIVDLTLDIESCDSNIYNVAANITGGVPPYELTWSLSDTLDVHAGNHNLTVTDSLGCEIITPFSVDTSEQMLVEVTYGEVDCLDTITDATIVIQGGLMPYTIEWSDGTLNLFTKSIHFGAGEYVKILDSRGCEIVKNFDISGPSKIHLGHIVESSTCGRNNGSIKLTPTGGSGSYAYKLNNSQVSSKIENLAPDVYSITIIDSKGCMLDTTIVVPEIPVAQLLGYTLIDNQCYGDSNGSISVKFIDESLSLSWSNSDTSRFIENLAGGKYKLTVLDTVGCVWDTTFVIDDGNRLNAKFTNSFNPCVDPEGELNVVPSGGVEPYSFVWNDGSEEDFVTIDSIGLYSVTITDSIGCSEKFNFSVSGDPVGGNTCFKIPNAFSPNGDGFNDVWEIKGIEVFVKSNVQIFDRWGKQIVNISGYNSNNFWNGQKDGNEMEVGTYYYIVDLNKKGTSVFKGSVSIKR